MSDFKIPMEWEQNKAGLTDEWMMVKKSQLPVYFEAADSVGVKIAYETRGKMAMLFCEPDQDMEELLGNADELQKMNK